MLALLASRYQLEIWGCEDPGPLRAVGIRASSSAPPQGADTLHVAAPFAALPQLSASTSIQR